MIKLKRLLSALLCVCLVLIGIAGCSSGSGDAKEEKTEEADSEKPESIQVMVGSDHAPYHEVVAERYEEKYGIKVELIVDAYDNQRNKAVAAATSGATEDIVVVDSCWPTEFANAGILAPITPYMSDELIESLVPVALEQATVDGEVWYMPTVNETKWLYYNKAKLQEAGYDHAPATWEELEEMSRTMIDKNLVKYGISWGAAQAEGLTCDWAVLMNSFGEDSWFDESGKWNLNSEKAKVALDFFVGTIKNGIADPASITYDDRQVLNTLAAGDVAFVLNWSFAWAVLNNPDESSVSGNVAIGCVPGSEKYGTVSGSTTGGGGYGILANSDAKEWAYKYLEMIVEPEFMVEALEITNNMPVTAETYVDEEVLKEYPHLEDCFPQYEYELVRPLLVQYNDWSLLVQQNLHSALSGASTVDEALDNLQKQAESQITP